jgi:hypothetical protein
MPRKCEVVNHRPVFAVTETRKHENMTQWNRTEWMWSDSGRIEEQAKDLRFPGRPGPQRRDHLVAPADVRSGTL